MGQLFSKKHLIKAGITTSGSWIDLFRDATWFLPVDKTIGRNDRLIDLNMSAFLYLHNKTRSIGLKRHVYKGLWKQMQMHQKTYSKNWFVNHSGIENGVILFNVQFDVAYARKTVKKLLKDLN